MSRASSKAAKAAKRARRAKATRRRGGQSRRRDEPSWDGALVLSTDPSQRRQLGKGGGMILWRDGAEPGKREGLAVSLLACGDPDCPCTELQLAGHTIDADATSVTFKDITVRVTWPDDAPAGNTELERDAQSRHINAFVDLPTGQVTEEGTEEEELRSWLASEMDGELLAFLHTAWLACKGLRTGGQRRDIDLIGWEPGQEVGFEEIFADERWDCYPLRERLYRCDTYFCITPDCDCNEARVVFTDVKEPPENTVGTMRLGLSTASADEVKRVAVELDQGPEELLRELWDAFCKRHRAGEYLRRRAGRMKEAGGEILRAHLAAPARTRTGRVGRNEPCPCGSGRKYKRCCIDAPDSPGSAETS